MVYFDSIEIKSQQPCDFYWIPPIGFQVSRVDIRRAPLALIGWGSVRIDDPPRKRCLTLSQNPTRKLNYFGLIILSICLAGKPGARREACKLNSQNETQTYWERKVWRVQNERKYPKGMNEANFIYTYIYLYIEPIYLVRREKRLFNFFSTFIT